MTFWILLGIIVLLIASIIGIYNGLVRGRLHVNESWSGIDVQLKRRHDLIPNLIETVKGYMKHEQKVLEEVTRLRSEVTGASGKQQKANLENGISQALKTIFAVSEAYPDLKANQNFQDLQKNLTNIESELQLARRYYNGTVRDYNYKVESFPSNLVAQAFQFKKEEFFEIEVATEREAPKVQF
ncbi:MAG: LemA family protein [Candidatus Omnitrophica bacterium]|nr:LemA family protein [Candidatus Omnitrophota bacterium]MCB9747355.1 LemA family protein [Candidatus Omnitrophota bacterium]